MPKLVITIDGPAGVGKSTVASLLAAKLNAAFLDTGAMYRAVTLACMERALSLDSEQAIIAVFDDTAFDFEMDRNLMQACINGKDVTERIRDPEVTKNARYIAACPEARERLVDMQRRFAQKYEKIVTEGRDQGTVAFPDADFKFFLDARPDERAARRHKQLIDAGKKADVKIILDEIEKRDASDVNRTTGPLKPAEDAFIIDSTNIDASQVVEKMLEIISQHPT